MSLKEEQLKVGAFFTPLEWAVFAIAQSGIFEKWIEGATIFDPTMGEGGLLEALLLYGQSKGVNINKLPVNNLYGVELNTGFFVAFKKRMRDQYSIEFSENQFLNSDILFLKQDLKFDILFGNPPWQNYVDLPEEYKLRVKDSFFKYGLVEDRRKLLLGGSRIDIAALIIQKTIYCNLKAGGEAWFFMPLSLLLNEGASMQFRKFTICETRYALRKVYDLEKAEVFKGVNTRYGLVNFKRDAITNYPVDYQYYNNGIFEQHYARPLLDPTNSLSILPEKKADPLKDFNLIKIPKKSIPRQGLNTCGANDIYFFDNYKLLEGGYCQISNRRNTLRVPRQFVFPLIDKTNFKEELIVPKKWVLLPYTLENKPLGMNELLKYPTLLAYFNLKREILIKRKGPYIKSLINRGFWWALLGVGEYNFASFKIVWESYGRKLFLPKIFSGQWQAGQSLQSFIPCESEEEADRICKALGDKQIMEYLLSLKMDGTMNWAQPGKIKKLLILED